MRHAAALWLALCLPAPAFAAGELDLATMTCRQVAAVEPMEVQNTILGAAVGYAMGEAAAPFDLDSVNAWYAALSALCNEAPDAPLAELMPLLADRAEAMMPGE